jgi:hypothetical protein
MSIQCRSQSETERLQDPLKRQVPNGFYQRLYQAAHHTMLTTRPLQRLKLTTLESLSAKAGKAMQAIIQLPSKCR